MKGAKADILYLMHVPWSWIEQRPHIVATQLAQHNKVTVAASRSLFKTVLGKDRSRAPQGVDARNLWYLPRLLNRGVFEKGADWLCQSIVKDADSFDVMWLTMPTQVSLIPASFQGLVVYDCMDDHVAMAREEDKARLQKQENELLKIADVVFVSSLRLAEKHGRADSVLVRNGYKAGEVYPIKSVEVKDSCTLAYFGTIDSWFDFASLEQLSSACGNVSVRLVGPARVSPELENVEYKGPVPHDALYDAVQDCDCLVMPFRVNDIILAVDPVKLYEYIAFGKCIISVEYPEVERFRDFVYFYSTPDEFCALVQDLAAKGFPPKYDEQARKGFLDANTWEQRVATMEGAIINAMENVQRGAFESE